MQGPIRRLRENCWAAMRRARRDLASRFAAISRVQALSQRIVHGRQFLCALALLPLLSGIYVVAFWLRFDGALTAEEQATLHSTLGIVALVKLASFSWFRIFQSWSRFVTFHDLIALVQATTTASILIALADYLVISWSNVPRSIFLMDWLATIVAVAAIRSARRFIAEHLIDRISVAGKQRVFIIGVTGAGEALLRTIRNSREIPFHVIGFIDENRDVRASHIGGIPVLGRLNNVFELARRHNVVTLLVTGDRLSGRKVRELIDAARHENVEVKMLPSYEHVIDGRLTFKPRDVSIEDLLRREPARLDTHELHDWIDGQVVMVTGSSGSIGSEICRQLMQFEPRKLLLIDRAETGQFFLERELRPLNSDVKVVPLLADVTDGLRMSNVFSEHRPAIVFHAAAYKHVPLVECNPGEGVKNIVTATRLLADLAVRFHVSSFVMISTDKAVNPTSVMGCCKRVAELYVQSRSHAAGVRFVAVRFGNVLDSAGSVIPVFRQQIAAGGPVTVTHPGMTRYFMTIPESSQLVIQAGMMGHGGEVFVLDMGEPARIVDLAADMVRLSGLRLHEDIELEFIGLRPGEKLFEELLVTGEEQSSTRHSKIMVVTADPPANEEVDRQIDRLCKLADGPPQLIVEQLERIVPTYHVPTVPQKIATSRAA